MILPLVELGLRPYLALWASMAGPFGAITDTGVPSPNHDSAEMWAEASDAFDAHLRALHPPGSEAEALRAALLREGFVLAGEGEARLAWPGFMCSYDWVVRWTEAEGRVASVEGVHSGACF